MIRMAEDQAAWAPPRFIVTLLIACALALPVCAAEHRCGWYINLTAGDLWLQDKDALWTITSQMQANGPDAVGADDHAPHFEKRDFVATQPGGYGYACACLQVDTDRGTKRITKVYAGQIISLSRCKNDRSLPPPT